MYPDIDELALFSAFAPPHFHRCYTKYGIVVHVDNLRAFGVGTDKRRTVIGAPGEDKRDAKWRGNSQCEGFESSFRHEEVDVSNQSESVFEPGGKYVQVGYLITLPFGAYGDVISHPETPA